MKGILGDAIIIGIVILMIGLLTYRLWMPPLVRLFRDVKDDIDKANRDMLN